MKLKSGLSTQMRISNWRDEVLKRLLCGYQKTKENCRSLIIVNQEKQEIKHFGTYIKSELFDLTECKYAQNGPSRRGKFYLDIKDICPSDCNICGFLSKRQRDLQLLNDIDIKKLNRINDPKGTLQKFKSVSESILGGISPHGKPCKEMSDAVISVEAKAICPTIILLSMDSDFELLGEVLNIPTCVHTKHEILNS